VGLLLATLAWRSAAWASAPSRPFSASATGEATGGQVATFAAGCFWGVEARFRKQAGVVDTEVGYTGGRTQSPSYEEVCADTTGHAEAVRVTFDPTRTSYERLLQTFWTMHDPTTLNRQGPDVGSQYRSAIFFHTPEQRVAAERSRSEAQTRMRRPIVTEIVPAGAWWRAEEYHQQYLAKNAGAECH
jgi:peptide-methionine (S)-S-oxide reductase